MPTSFQEYRYLNVALEKYLKLKLQHLTPSLLHVVLLTGQNCIFSIWGYFSFCVMERNICFKMSI
jgi:hypothetical protein